MSKRTGEKPEAVSAFRAGPPPERTPLRDNLEYVAVLILIVLVLRQVVVEAFRIQHGSMAPTLLGAHREVRCPNCGYVFEVGVKKIRGIGRVECVNCRHVWPGAGQDGYSMSRPAWLWNSGRDSEGRRVTGAVAANRVDRGPSRIFVNKFLYELREPRRWEVVVFVYPYRRVHCPHCTWFAEVGPGEELVCPDCGARDLVVHEARSYIKRVTGLPGETLDLRDGDVWANGRLVRKPQSVQNGLWFHVFDSAFMPRVEDPPVWDFGRSSGAWREEGPAGKLVVDSRGRGEAATARYARRISDFYSYDGLSYQVNPGVYAAPGRYEVGDCRVRALVRMLDAEGDAAAVLLGIRDGGHDFSLEVGAAEGRAVLSDGELPLREAPAPRLTTGDAVWLELENYDDRAVVKADGRLLISLDYEGRPGPLHEVSFGARDAQVSFDRIVIDRDVYYNDFGGESEKQYRLEDGQYFVVGDNCPASSDSRLWGPVPIQNFVGKAFFVFWPVHHMGFL